MVFEKERYIVEMFQGCQSTPKIPPRIQEKLRDIFIILPGIIIYKTFSEIIVIFSDPGAFVI